MMLLIWDTGMGLEYAELDSDSEQAQWARESAGKYINGDDLHEGHPIWRLNDSFNNEDFHKLTYIKRAHYTEIVVCGMVP